MKKKKSSFRAVLRVAVIIMICLVLASFALRFIRRKNEVVPNLGFEFEEDIIFDPDRSEI